MLQSGHPTATTRSATRCRPHPAVFFDIIRATQLKWSVPNLLLHSAQGTVYIANLLEQGCSELKLREAVVHWFQRKVTHVDWLRVLPSHVAMQQVDAMVGPPRGAYATS